MTAEVSITSEKEHQLLSSLRAPSRRATRLETDGNLIGSTLSPSSPIPMTLTQPCSPPCKRSPSSDSVLPPTPQEILNRARKDLASSLPLSHEFHAHFCQCTGQLCTNQFQGRPRLPFSDAERKSRLKGKRNTTAAEQALERLRLRTMLRSRYASVQIWEDWQQCMPKIDERKRNFQLGKILDKVKKKDVSEEVKKRVKQRERACSKCPKCPKRKFQPGEVPDKGNKECIGEEVTKKMKQEERVHSMRPFLQARHWLPPETPRPSVEPDSAQFRTCTEQRAAPVRAT